LGSSRVKDSRVALSLNSNSVNNEVVMKLNLVPLGIVCASCAIVQGALRSNKQYQGLAAAPVRSSFPLSLATASAPAPAPADNSSHYVKELANSAKDSIKNKVKEAVGSDKEVDGLGKQFYARDLNGDGYLTIPEMDVTDTSSGGNVMHAHLQDQIWFDCMDTNNNHKVTLKEWVVACRNDYKKVQECSKDRIDDNKKYFFHARAGRYKQR